METQVALMRAVHLPAYRIALALKVRRQSVDQILRRPHVAVMVEDVRERLHALQLLRDGACEWGEANPDGSLPAAGPSSDGAQKTSRPFSVMADGSLGSGLGTAETGRQPPEGINVAALYAPTGCIT